MKTIILAVAEQELSEAIAYYNSECPGLGYELALDTLGGSPSARDYLTKMAS